MTDTGTRSEPRRPPKGSEAPLTARSVIASTLLGMRPPRLDTAILVRSCALFGISEGATRVAISRMVAAEELAADGAGYRLTGALLTRQDRQEESRLGPGRRWDGRWSLAVVVADGRAPGDRAELRTAAAQLRLGELREGVWLRPTNLADDRLPTSRAVLDQQCRSFTARLDEVGTHGPAPALVASLWDLDGWAARARLLAARLADLQGDLDRLDLSVLGPGFVLSAAVLRHLQADPLLPAELLGDDWPGDDLRRTYERFDAAFKALWTTWYRDQR